MTQTPDHHNRTTLEADIGYGFSDKSLLETALTHSSSGRDTNYERLEFLGDRVLGLVVSEILYGRYAGETEGDLAKRLAALVQGSFLAKIAAKIKLGQFIEFSASEKQAGGDTNENILADAVEALIGAIYVDSGLEACRDFIIKHWGNAFDNIQKPPQHPKTELQEWAQSRGLPLPVYKITGQSGPDHAPIFDICLKVSGFEDLIAQGRSRQEGEKEAAKAFLRKLEKRK
jgi:ribonuclease III